MPQFKPLTGNAGDFSGIVLKAAASGNIPAVKHYLAINPAWLNMEGPHGRTLLWEAVNRKRLDLVAELIRMGADVNPMGSYYTPMLVDLTALAVAQRNGDDAMIELLIRHGATDCLHSACYRGDLEALKRFFVNDPDAANRPSRTEPFHPRMGWNPVHYAVAGHQSEVLKFLFEHGATTGLHLDLLVDWAEGDSEIIALLRRQQQSEPLSASGTHNELAGLDTTPEIDRPDWLGFPALVDACRGNHNAPDDPSRVRKLLDRGANINVVDHKGKTPLHRAAQAGFVGITTLLLNRGADSEIADNLGGTPIFDAAYYGRAEVLNLLIVQGANFRHLDSRGETALFAAARGRRLATFQLLLNQGVDPDHANARGKTVANVIQRARNQQTIHEELLACLESGTQTGNT